MNQRDSSWASTGLMELMALSFHFHFALQSQAQGRPDNSWHCHFISILHCSLKHRAGQTTHGIVTLFLFCIAVSSTGQAKQLIAMSLRVNKSFIARTLQTHISVDSQLRIAVVSFQSD